MSDLTTEVNRLTDALMYWQPMMKAWAKGKGLSTRQVADTLVATLHRDAARAVTPPGERPDLDVPTRGAWPDTFAAGFAWGRSIRAATPAAPEALNRERLRRHIHQSVCDPRAFHDLTLGRCGDIVVSYDTEDPIDTYRGLGGRRIEDASDA